MESFPMWSPPISQVPSSESKNKDYRRASEFVRESDETLGELHLRLFCAKGVPS